ncbi:(Fe-S)-binding protein [Alkalicoccus chagannorensis]|uniref:(Fe-S)-binding protein n=1 Tax=Alkalicoccus chagannorensis TaxID=427072 RepID=UPI00042800E1|nr:heterodisulfide reductase-related iron-sulfur binding cluster [Alkalicoccus chagannorensis]
MSIQQDFQEHVDYEELMNCTRCGFCLPACPTYLHTDGNEASSPRGRIALMKAVADGRKEPDEEVEAQLQECLGCRACEPACPSGVPYGQLLEQARTVIEKHKKHSLPVKVLRGATFGWMFLSQKRMNRVHQMRRLYEKTPLQQLMRRTNAFALLPGEAAVMEKVIPKAVPASRIRSVPKQEKAETTEQINVAFFRGCLMSTMFAETNENTRYVLRRSGCNIVHPEAQECCGALHAHGGEEERAKALARQNIEAFEAVEADVIISNAGGCGAALKDYPFLLRDDPEFKERAKVFAEKSMDVSTLLDRLDLPPMQYDAEVVTYQPSCHLENVMKEKGHVESLLRGIEGVSYTAMPQKEQCCGSAGIYNLIQPKMAMRILDRKMKDVSLTRASVIITSNPGCLLQMKAGIEREGLSGEVRAEHIMDFTAEAIRRAEKEAATSV